VDSEHEPSGHTLEQVDNMCRTHVIRAIGAQLGSIFTPWSARRSGPGARRPRPTEATDARIAACALLLEIAYADGEFTEEERRHVESTVAEQFGLDACEARRLVEAADDARAGTAQVWHFTRAVRSYSEGQKALLSDILHALAHLDGAATTQEAYTMEKINTLLRVKPAYGAVGV
jgi:uncharacterized tellurite resistance protein B-like protein